MTCCSLTFSSPAAAMYLDSVVNFITSNMSFVSRSTPSMLPAARDLKGGGVDEG